MLDGFPPLQYLLVVFAGWVNRQQLDVIDYLKEENRVLREMLSDQRLRFTDAQRRRLAEKAKRLGRKVLSAIGSIVTPDTLMAYAGRPCEKTGVLQGSAEVSHHEDIVEIEPTAQGDERDKPPMKGA